MSSSIILVAEGYLFRKEQRWQALSSWVPLSTKGLCCFVLNYNLPCRWLLLSSFCLPLQVTPWSQKISWKKTCACAVQYFPESVEDTRVLADAKKWIWSRVLTHFGSGKFKKSTLSSLYVAHQIDTDKERFWGDQAKFHIQRQNIRRNVIIGSLRRFGRKCVQTAQITPKRVILTGQREVSLLISACFWG